MRLLQIPLSRLVPGRRNPRRVKPAREAHHVLVALIRSQGLTHPLVVRAGENKHFEIVAGKRRFEALKEIYKGKDAEIDCILRDVDAVTAHHLALGENFGREPMHPLDEAEAFAKLATTDGKDAEAIAAEFGVKEQYVRQRMKLADLASPVKEAYRKGEIDTGAAEAFSAVPKDRQVEVWKELNGHARHADHVRNIIANGWIDSSHALFDVAKLPEGAISRDLFGERILIERQTFMEAQSQALDSERQGLIEEGWKEVVAGCREDVRDRLLSMDTPEPEYDRETTRRLVKTAKQREKLEQVAEKIGNVHDPRYERIQRRYEALEAKEHKLVQDAPVCFSEETKSLATVFLMLDPDGKVHRAYRVPHRKHQASDKGNGQAESENAMPPTSDELSDKQLATTFTHEALAVREALLGNAKARKRILALILHDKVRSEALAIRHESNGTNLHATMTEGFTSAAFNQVKEKRVKVDPFEGEHHVEDCEGYEQLGKLSDGKIDALIDLLIVNCITAHMQKKTELVGHLAEELKVDFRANWRPDTTWLSSYQKIQLSHLMAELYGKIYDPNSEQRKKSELVDVLAKLFADAAEGKLEDKKLTERVNGWLPSNLRNGPLKK